MISNKLFNISTIISVLTLVCSLCNADEITNPRIVNGDPVEKGRYPYMVLLDGGSCGGSLIAPKYVLTAAHCAGLSEVAIGRHDLSDSSESFESIRIAREIIHPNYNDNLIKNDVMILELRSEVSSKYTPVVLDENTENLNPGDPVTVMGWGTTSSGGPTSTILLETEVNVVSNSACESAYDSTSIFEGSLCGYREGTDSCQGDSGGPLIVKRDNFSNDVQVGIVSWGNGCAEPGFPGVYARVSTYVDWIKRNAGLDSSPTPPSPTPPSPTPPSPTPPSPTPPSPDVGDDYYGSFGGDDVNYYGPFGGDDDNYYGSFEGGDDDSFGKDDNGFFGGDDNGFFGGDDNGFFGGDDNGFFGDGDDYFFGLGGGELPKFCNLRKMYSKIIRLFN